MILTSDLTLYAVKVSCAIEVDTGSNGKLPS